MHTLLGLPLVFALLLPACGPGDDKDPGTDCSSDAEDFDGDGVSACAGDCDDGNPSVIPGSVELCDGIDNNCAEGVDEGFDADLDGVATCAGDCDDGAVGVHTGSPETCADLGIDNNCNGDTEDFDADAPDLVEVYVDVDADGYGDDEVTELSCGASQGTSEVGGDCDDSSPTAYPGAFDRCLDAIDADCDGIDDVCPDNWRTLDDSTFHIGGINPGGKIGSSSVATLDNGNGMSVWLASGSADGSRRVSAVDIGAPGAYTDSAPGAQVPGSVVSALGGDFTGDGIEDVLVGDPDYADGAGEMWVYSGALRGSFADTSQASLRIVGDVSRSVPGTMVASVGDIDGSGGIDLLVGGWRAGETEESGLCCASVWLLVDPVGPTVSVEDADLEFRRPYASNLREIAATGEDLDGDGIEDILIGDMDAACIEGSQNGLVMVLSGTSRGTLSGADAADGFRCGDDVGERFGASVAMGPDLTGDGYPEMLVGGPHYGENGAFPGVVRVFSGGPNLAKVLLEPVGSLIGETSASLGAAVASPGDMDGDGSPDVAVSQLRDVGGSVLFFSSPVVGTWVVGAETSRWISGGGADQSGYSITPAADLTGDGLTDLWVGAPTADGTSEDGGAIYLISQGP